MHGNLELRVDDWINYDENGTAFDNRLVEMGWNFRNTSDLNYDGIKVKFLYNTELTNDKRQSGSLAYTDNFDLFDMYSKKLNIDKNEPIWLNTDDQTNWQLERGRSKKLCLDRGVCAFIAGFSRDYETSDENGEDILMRIGYNITYQSYGFYAQYLTYEARLKSNTVV